MALCTSSTGTGWIAHVLKQKVHNKSCSFFFFFAKVLQVVQEVSLLCIKYVYGNYVGIENPVSFRLFIFRL